MAIQSYVPPRENTSFRARCLTRKEWNDVLSKQPRAILQWLGQGDTPELHGLSLAARSALLSYEAWTHSRRDADAAVDRRLAEAHMRSAQRHMIAYFDELLAVIRKYGWVGLVLIAGTLPEAGGSRSERAGRATKRLVLAGYLPRLPAREYRSHIRQAEKAIRERSASGWHLAQDEAHLLGIDPREARRDPYEVYR